MQGRIKGALYHKCVGFAFVIWSHHFIHFHRIFKNGGGGGGGGGRPLVCICFDGSS